MADVSKATQTNNGLAIQVYNEQSCLLMEKRMRIAYQSAIDELQKELDDFYEKYATDNKIDLQVAKQKLSLSDSESVKDLAEQYKQLLSKKNIGVRTQKKLDEIAAKTKVSRLEQLLVNCTKQAAEVGMKAKDEMIDVGSLMYKDGFGHTMFNIQKTVGMGVNFNMPSARVIKTASNVEWLGTTFTDRTGYTLDRLTNNIEQIIPQLFIQGKNADEFGKAIAKQFNMSENAAKRDMRTLTTLITNQASILAYNNCEMVEEFEFVATLDGKTSDKCRAMDGKRFKLNEAAPFVNQPPLHYNCRSTTIPYFEDLDEYNPSERVARDEQGKTYMVPANMSYKEWCTKHAQGLYANSDKTDWNYKPEKILAYERIVDERRKLKALQEDRVVYQDSDFVVDHDISNYSEDDVKHLMRLFNMSTGESFDILEQASNMFKQHSGNNYWGNFNTDIYDGLNANAKMKYNSLKFVGYDNTRGTLMGGIASYRNSFASIGNVVNMVDALNNAKLPKALRDVDREIFNRMLNVVSDALNPAKGNGLMRLVDERKQSVFLGLFNDKYINNGNINIFVDVQRLVFNNLSSFKNCFHNKDYELLTSLRTKLDVNEISKSEVSNELYRIFNDLSEVRKAAFMRNIENAMYTYETKKINYLVDIDRNELNWGTRLIKPKITEYEVNKEQIKLLFIDALKGSYAVVNNSLDGFDDFISSEKIDSRQQLQQKINETMTKINNIRKELNSDKTANILSAKDYNDIIDNLHKYYEMLNDEYDILNEKSSYQKYVKVMGLNDKPETMSKQDFQAYIAENKDLPVLYRAVTDAGPTGTANNVTRGKYLRRGILNDLMYGSQQYIGDGVYGDGLYFSTQPTHGSYGKFSGSKETAIDRKYMIQATFKSGAKKILWDDLRKLMGEYKKKGYNVGDPSSFARSLGYQIIQCHSDGTGEIYYNILDRSALVIQDVDKESAKLSPEEQKRRIILADKASIRDKFTKTGMLNVMNMQFATRQQNPNLFSYNEIVAFDAAVNNEELAALINFTFKNELYTDELQKHLKIKDFYDEYDNVAEKFKQLASDDEIEIDYLGKKVKIKKYDIYNEIIDMFEGGDGSEESVRSQGVSATYKAIAFIRNKLNEGLSTDDLVKLNSQLTINEMANRLSNALDALVDSAYSNVEDYIDISAKKELNIKEIKQKIGDSIKQKNPIDDDQIILNMKRSVVNRNSSYDIQNFVMDKTILDDDVFGNLEILINFEKYAKDVLDTDIYEEVFNNVYDELYEKMNNLFTSDDVHDFILFKNNNGTSIKTRLALSDLKDWLDYMESDQNGSIEDKSLALEKIKYELRIYYFEHIISRTINDGDAEGTDLDDVDTAVKNYIDKFTKQTQNIVEGEIKRKQGGDTKISKEELEKEMKNNVDKVESYYMDKFGEDINMFKDEKIIKRIEKRRSEYEKRDIEIKNLYQWDGMLNDDIMSKVFVLRNAKDIIKEELKDINLAEELMYENYENIVNELKSKLNKRGEYEFKLNVNGKNETFVVSSKNVNQVIDAIDGSVQQKEDALSRVISDIRYDHIKAMQKVEERGDKYNISGLQEIANNYQEKFKKKVSELFTYMLNDNNQQSEIHTLTSEEIKGLERKDTYDFKELQRKALKEFKYYKGTMKKAEIQNESLRKDERISKNNEKYFQQTMRGIFEKNDFCMRLNKNVLPLIAESKFMNQFETGNAPLGLTFNQRRAVAKKMFTIPEDAEGSEYEKYGFLGSKNPKDDFKDDENFTGDYGDTIVRFKKRNLMHRTTFTIGDSLFNCINDNVRSSPVINPQIASIQRGHVNEVIYGLNVVENANAEKSYLDIQALTRQKYVELQYHGNLIIDDVESVTFNKKTTNVNNPEVRKIIAMLKERGIKCYLVDSNKEVIQEV